jgi:hypothetical protein
MKKTWIKLALIVLLTNVVVNVGIGTNTDEDHPDPMHMKQ